MKSYTIKITTETKQHCSPIELSYLKDHIDEIAQGRDDGRAIIEQDDVIRTAITALRTFHSSEIITYLEIITCECYCDLDRYVPAIMADVLVYYWLDGKPHYSKLSALGIERRWLGDPVTAYIQDFTESGDRCI